MAYTSRKNVSKTDAKRIAKQYGIDFDKSPYQLTTDEKDYLLELAKKTGYQKSRNSGSNLSRASAFFEHLKKY